MQTKAVKTNQLSTAAYEWLQQKYSSVDSTNLEGYASFLADDCVLQFGNNPLEHGKEAILTGISHFWSSIKGLDHSFQNIFGSDHAFAAEANIDYMRLDGRVVTIPCVTVIERNDAGLATSIRIFIDVAPIFA